MSSGGRSPLVRLLALLVQTHEARFALAETRRLFELAQTMDEAIALASRELAEELMLLDLELRVAEARVELLAWETEQAEQERAEENHQALHAE